MKLIVLTLSLGLTALPAFARSGHTVNNGAERPAVFEDAVWFGDAKREIKTCLDLAPDFGVSAEEAKRTVNQAFAAWERYLEAKRVRAEMQKRGIDISMRLAWAGGCTGAEDLKISLGSQDPEMTKAAAEYSSPLGFARRTEFNEETLWGRGFIWIAPPGNFSKEKLDWSQQNRLLGILMHEIGHVLGCGHVWGTIMRDNLADDILRDMPSFINTFDRIDAGRQLVLCQGCPVKLSGRITDRAALTKLLGANLSEEAWAGLALVSDFAGTTAGVIQITDGNRRFLVKAEVGAELASAKSDTPLFKMPRGKIFGGYSARTASSLKLLTLRYADRTLLVAYRVNEGHTYTAREEYQNQVLSLDPQSRDNVIFRFAPTESQP